MLSDSSSKYNFGKSQQVNDSDWYSTKQKPVETTLYPYNHIDDIIIEKLEQHMSRVNNPHQVTLQQLNVDKLFTHNIRVEYDKDKPEIHLILVDLNGNDLADVGPINIDISAYSKEELEKLKLYLEEKINDLYDNIIQIIDSKISNIEIEFQNKLDAEIENVSDNLSVLDNKINNLTVEDISDDRISVNQNIEFKNSSDEIVAKITDNNIIVNDYFKLAPALYSHIEENLVVTLKNEEEHILNNSVLNCTFKFDNSVRHGYCSSVTFSTEERIPVITFDNDDNESQYPLKYIFRNSFVENLPELESDYQYNLIVLCNGINLEIYIQEIKL